MIRVLVVDDSPTVRKLIRTLLNGDPELKVVAEAENGLEAIEMCRKMNPDVITMDIQMPVMNGYEAIKRIMTESPRPIVILTSTESEIKHGITDKGIEAGALMVGRKPGGLSTEQKDTEKLVSLVKAMAEVKVVRRRWDLTDKWVAPHPIPTRRKSFCAPFGILGLGASTGGPPALKSILAQLNIPLHLPVVVVQHISQGFINGLAKWLDESIPLHVKVAENGEQLKAGTVYLAPGKRHFQVSGGKRVWLINSDPVDGHRPSVTCLFDSIAKNYGQSAICVLLTGMGKDGAKGLLHVKDRGGYTMVQDKETSVVFGMPGEAIALGAASEVVPLHRMGLRLTEMVG